MKKFLVVLATLCAAVIPVRAQGPIPSYYTGPQQFAGVPTGACSFQLAVNTVNGHLYDCLNGAWNDVGSTGGGGNALTSNPLSQFAATTSAQLAGVLSDETGTGLAVFATNPVFTTPNLGTPSAINLTNATSPPTWNQNTTGSAASLSVSGQTGLLTFTGITSTNRAKTVRDAADTLLELGGSYTPTGTWTSMSLVTPSIGAATGTSLSVTGSLTSTVATGTAPLVVSSTTNVANLNASSLNGATFAAPGNIGSTTPAGGKFTSLTLGVLLTNNTAPTIAGAGCGGSAATISNQNGPSAFNINVGTAPTSGGCSVTLPAASNGWNCSVNNFTTISSTVFVQKQTASATNSATFKTFDTTGTAQAPTASDIYHVSCFAY